MEERAYQEQFELEDEHWWFQGRRAVIWSLLRRAELKHGMRLLDAGCGTGRNLIEFGTDAEAHGVDSSADAIEFCRRRGVDGVVQAPIEQLPFGEDAFDLVLATDVLEHLQDDLAALTELRRVSAPEGRLLATVPAYQWLWSQHDDAHHHFRRYTLRRLKARLQAAGWHPVVWSYFNTTLLPPIAAVRLLARRRPASEDLSPDLRLTPPLMNRLLERPMRVEASLIDRGIRLPAGVSIGIVCSANKAASARPEIDFDGRSVAAGPGAAALRGA